MISRQHLLSSTAALMVRQSVHFGETVDEYVFVAAPAASRVTWDTMRAAMARIDRDPNPPRRLLTAEETARPIPMLEETPPDDGTVEWQMMYGPGDGSRPLISDFPHKLTRLVVDGKDIPIA